MSRKLISKIRTSPVSTQERQIPGRSSVSKGTSYYGHPHPPVSFSVLEVPYHLGKFIESLPRVLGFS